MMSRPRFVRDAGGLKVLGFNAGQIGEMQQFNAFAGNLAGAGLGYAISGEMTLNVLNLKDLSGGALGSTGLLEMRIGGKDGFSMGMGTGGTDISFGTVATAMAGLSHWGMNIDIEAAARRDSVQNAATAMRGAYGFGDETDLAQLDSILKGGTRILAGGAGEGGQTITLNGTRYVTLKGVNEADTAEKKLALALTLSHEGRRDGVVDENNRMETRGAVLAHTEMAIRMLGDGATSSVMKGVIDASENLQMDLGHYMKAKLRGDDTLFDKYVDGTYDSSADYWKLVKTENGDYDFQWDGNLNIYDENGKKLMDYWDLATKGIREGLTLANGDTISTAMLREINGYNLEMYVYNLKNPSTAGTYLFGDGEMKYDEAKLVRDKIAKFPFLGVNMIEHYSARYVLNKNDILSTLVTDSGADEWMKPEDRARAESGDSSYWKDTGLGKARLLPEDESIFHGPGAFKWVFADRYELVINSKGQFDTSAEFLGTYNFVNPTDKIFDNIMHGFLDVAPYIQWGNSPDDKTPFLSRTGVTQTAGKLMNNLYNGASKIEGYY